MLQLILSRKIQAYFMWGIILGCLSLPSLLASIPTEDKESSASSSQAPTTKAPWESFIKEDTKKAIKDLSASFARLIQEDKDNELRAFIFAHLKAIKELKHDLIPAVFSDTSFGEGSRQIKVTHESKKNVYLLEEITGDLLYIVAARVLWDYQNILLDSDIVKATAFNINEFASRTPRAQPYQMLSMFVDYIYHRYQQHWMKATIQNLRLQYFETHLNLRKILFKNGSIYYDPFDYKINLFKPWPLDSFHGLKRKLADLFTLRTYEEDLFLILQEHETLSQNENFINVWRYTLTRSSILALCFPGIDYPVRQKAYEQIQKFQRDAQVRYASEQMKSEKFHRRTKERDNVTSSPSHTGISTDVSVDDAIVNKPIKLNRAGRKKAKAVEPSTPTHTGISTDVDVDDVMRFINGRLSKEDLKKKEQKASSSSANQTAKKKQKHKNKLKEESQPSTANTTHSNEVASVQNVESQQTSAKASDETLTAAAPAAKENQREERVNRWLQPGSLISTMKEVEKQKQLEKGTQPQQVSQVLTQNPNNAKKPITSQRSALQTDSQKVKPALTKEQYKQRASAAPSRQAPTARGNQQPVKNFKRSNNLS